MQRCKNMLKYLTGSIVLIAVLPLYSAQLSSIPEHESGTNTVMPRSGRPIGLMSKRFYRSRSERKRSAESPDEKYASLSAAYNQLEELYTKAKRSNTELARSNTILRRVAFERNPYRDIEQQNVPGFGNITISSNNIITTTTTTTSSTLTCIMATGVAVRS